MFTYTVCILTVMMAHGCSIKWSNDHESTIDRARATCEADGGTWTVSGCVE